MNTADLARRFLHVNHNTVDADAAQLFFTDCLGLRLHMRTDPDVLSDGEILGLSGKVRTDTRFLYDSRGPRRSCAMEVVEWVEPPTAAHSATASAGLAAVGFAVADRAHTVAMISSRGFEVVSADAVGLISGRPATVVLGPDGVVVEICDLPGAPAGTVHFVGARITCVDLEASTDFYTGVGFGRLGDFTTATVRLRDLGIDADGDEEIRTCHVGLPEDADSARLCLMQPGTHLDVPALNEANRQGLYRCALRVENTRRAMAATTDGIAVRGPIWCPLPGTPIAGLDIAFMTAPDGVVVEYVERPLSHFV